LDDRAGDHAGDGGAGDARFVGGAVRDAFAGRWVVDIDIAVPCRLAGAGAAQRKSIKVVETGLEHGTVTAIAGTHAFEITSLRRDVEDDGRHARSLHRRLGRRRGAARLHHQCASMLSLSGEIFDTPTGVEDLIAGKVRFMGDARRRIAEDYLGYCGCFAFHAWYGKGEIDAEGLRAGRRGQDKLKTLSAERVAKELLRLAGKRQSRPVLRVMAATGILSELLRCAAIAAA